MARETKIGLIVGLSFIICFAVILANRGRQAPVTTYWPYLVDRGVSAHRTNKPDASGSLARRLPSTPSGSRPPAQPATSASADGSAQMSIGEWRMSNDSLNRQSTEAPTSGAEVMLSHPGSEWRMRASGLRSGISDRGSGVSASSPQSPTPKPDLPPPIPQTRSLNGRGVEASRNGRQDKGSSGGEKPDQPTGVHESSSISPPASAVRHRQAGDGPPSVRYTVVPGDTLSKITAVHYRSRSPALINAIFTVNAGVLSSPDILAVGDELILPEVDGLNRPSGAELTAMSQTTPHVRNTMKPTTSPQSAGGGPDRSGGSRWYQIKKNDRYVSIAREQLGDVNRWKEIYELNKDIFPDPERIRYGVRIKLPVRLRRIATAEGP